jgi:putative Flp pilus-assembly TadE/G-like protein
MNIKDSRGQAMVLTVVFLTVLLGAAALSLDVGSWYHQKRQLQAKADAAALAGAQALPLSTSDAQALAIQYAAENGGTLNTSDITFSTDYTTNDTISVKMSEPAPGFFSKLFGLNTVTVGAHAAARSDKFDQAKYAAPIGVQFSHPLLSGSGCPCFDQPTTLTLDKVGPGGFKLLNLDGTSGGINPHTLADWMEHGLDAWMPLGNYWSDPGAKFDSGGMQTALDDNIGKELLFPVYDSISGNGSNLTYHVIGWVGFVITSYAARGNNGTLDGHFTRVIWQGLQGARGGNSTDFGNRSIQLVN